MYFGLTGVVTGEVSSNAHFASDSLARDDRHQTLTKHPDHTDLSSLQVSHFHVLSGHRGEVVVVRNRTRDSPPHETEPYGRFASCSERKRRVSERAVGLWLPMTTGLSSAINCRGVLPLRSFARTHAR